MLTVKIIIEGHREMAGWAAFRLAGALVALVGAVLGPCRPLGHVARELGCAMRVPRSAAREA